MEFPAELIQPSLKDIGWIDIHTHLNFLEISPQEAVEKALASGFHHLITIGTEPEDLPIVLDLAEKFSPHVYCTLGIHPHEGKVYDDQVEKFLKENLPSPRVVAVGEIGLDYYYNNSPAEEQIEAFRRQMQLAADLNMPVEIHTRDAEDDTIQILQEFKGRVGGLIHCFTGTERLAMAALDCGFNISFSGIVTFKTAGALRDVVLKVPVDRLHVETDAPFLAPMPVRGKKNVPENMLWTAQLVAELKGMPIVEFCQQMRTNAEKMFKKIQWQASSPS